MKLHRQRSRRSVTVDLVPMIDVVFQLILFFLVSTTFAVLPGISVNLPQSSTSQSVSTTGITVLASEDGRLWFNDVEVNFDSLDNSLASYDLGGKEKDEIPVSLEADDKVTNGTIVKIFDVLRKNGFSAVNLRTKSRQ